MPLEQPARPAPLRSPEPQPRRLANSRYLSRRPCVSVSVFQLSLSVLGCVARRTVALMCNGKRAGKVAPCPTHPGGVLKLARGVREALAEQVLAQGRYLLG